MLLGKISVLVNQSNEGTGVDCQNLSKTNTSCSPCLLDKFNIYVVTERK